MSSQPLRPAAQVLARQLPGGAVLVHLATNQIFELNETSARVWALLTGGLSAEAIVERLGEEFDVEPAQASREVGALLARLREAGLIGPG